MPTAPEIAQVATSRRAELEGQLAPDAYWRQATWKRVYVIAAGPLTNVLLAIVLFGMFSLARQIYVEPDE